MILNVKKTERYRQKVHGRRKTKLQAAVGCEAAYKMKKSGMREVLVWEKMKKIKTK